MQWQQFDISKMPPAMRRTHVTLDPLGVFYLNHGAMFDLGEPVAVRLMYEKDAGLIGIAAAPLKAKGAIELRTKYGEDSPVRIFHARQFCHHLGILPERTIMFCEPKLEDGVLILDLNTTIHAP